MTKQTMLLGALVIGTLLACKMGEDEAKQLEAIQTEACACKDKACADAALAKFKAAAQAMKETRVDQENATRISTASGEITKCLIGQGVAPSDVMDAVK